MSEPFSLAFVRPSTFGELAGVHLPAGVEAVTQEVLGRLHPAERALAGGFRGRRQIEFVGGRLAFRALRPDAPALGTGERGQPLTPAGLSVSVSHKEDLALALVGNAEHGTLGLDLEGDGRARMTIAERVLRPEERELVWGLDEAERWPQVLLRFALKEAAYKAIHPHLKRFVSFQEAAVTLLTDDQRPAGRAQSPPDEPPVTPSAVEGRGRGSGGRAAIEILGEPTLLLEAAWEELGGPRILASVRARRR